MHKIVTQCDICGVQHMHQTASGFPKDWIQVIIQGIPMVPVVALTRDLCPECAPKFSAMWMGQWDFPPKLWNEECIKRAQSQAQKQASSQD